MTTVTLFTDRNPTYSNGERIYALELVADENNDYVKEHNRKLHKKLFGSNIDEYGVSILYHDKRNRNKLRVSKYNNAPQRLMKTNIDLVAGWRPPEDEWKSLMPVYRTILNSFWSSSLIEKELYTFMHDLYARDFGSAIICVPEIIVKGKPIPEIGSIPTPNFSTIRSGPGTKIQHGQWGVRLYYYMLWDGYYPMEDEGDVYEDACNLREYLSKPDLLSRVPDICAKSISKCEDLIAMIDEMNSATGEPLDPDTEELFDKTDPDTGEPITDDITEDESMKQEEQSRQENHVTVSTKDPEIEKSGKKLLDGLLKGIPIARVIPILECALQEAKLMK